MKYVIFFLFYILFYIGCNPNYSIISPDIIDISDDLRIEIDIIQQPTKIENLDILVVLDKSCSMSDDSTIVGIGMGLLAQQMSSIATNYRFGFITTDPGCNEFIGPFDSSSTIIDIQLAPSQLNSMCGSEQGFAATYHFLSSLNELIREDSDLLIFLISDEDEQSSITAIMFKSWLTTYKQNLHLVDIVSITSLEEVTEEVTCSGTPGYKYIELMSLYGKNPINLCSEGWEDWLSQSSFLTATITSITLDYVPLSKEHIIVIDQYETVYNMDIDWTYNEITNQLEFLFEPTYDMIYIIAYQTLE